MAFTELGPAIRDARQKKGLSQDALAAALGVTQPSVSAWEAGRQIPGISMLYKLVEVTEADPVELFRLAAAAPASAACG